MKRVNYLKTIMYVVYYNLCIFKEKIFDECVNFLIWGCISTFVTGTLLVKSGLSDSFASVQFCGVIANVGLWMSFHEIVGFIMDIEHKKKIYYDLSIPLPSYLFFLAKVIYYAIRFSILTIIISILSKLIMYNIISFESMVIWKFGIIFIVANIFYGAWIIFISSIIKKSQNISNLFGRIQFPLWFMGGFQFSWITLYQANRYIAYLDLCNPILYINEGFKNAILGIPGILPFWGLVAIIVGFSIVLFYVGFRRLKMQLDFI